MDLRKKVVDLSIDDVLPNRFQPRIKFNEDSLNELSESIKEHGVIQPIVVRPVGDKYEIIAGERRYKASVLAGKTTIPAIITDLNDKDSAEVALIENVQRQNLTPIEEAISYKKILDMGYLNQTSLAEKLGKNQSTVANKIRLLDLDEEVQEALLNSKISERHARSLLKLQDKKLQVEMLNRIINERMTVRKTDEEIEKVMNNNMNNTNNLNNTMSGFKPFDQPVPDTYNTNSQPVEAPLSFESLFSNPTPVQETPVVSPQPVEFNNITQPQTSEPVINNAPVMNENPFAATEQPIESIDFSAQTNPGFMNVDRIVEDAKPVDAVNPFAVNKNVDMNSLVSSYNPQTSVESTTESPVLPQTPEVNNNNVITQPDTVQPAEDALQPKKFFNILEDETNDETPQPAQPVNPVNNENPFNFDNLFQPTSQTQQSAIEPQAPEIPIINQNVEPLNNFASTINNTPQESIQQNMDIPVQPASTMATHVETQATMVPPTISQTSSFETAIAAIRECATKLESLGYKQEHDDFDLGDMYQVIFRIEK